MAMGSLQVVKILFMNANRLLELLDVFRAAFTKGGLRLTIALFALLRCRVDLESMLEFANTLGACLNNLRKYIGV